MAYISYADLPPPPVWNPAVPVGALRMQFHAMEAGKSPAKVIEPCNSGGTTASLAWLPIAVAAAACRRRQLRVACCASTQETSAATATKKRSIAKETLARLRKRAPKRSGAQKAKKMPPSPDPWERDEEDRKIFPWPKSFAEIVQTSAYSSMELFMEGETRVEVCFPPLPLADLDWNMADITETRVVDANIQHAIAFGKFIIKDKRQFPKLDPVKALESAMQGGPVQAPDVISDVLKRRFKKREEGQAKTVRIVFPNKPDMLRARDIHFDKWQKMERPDLLRRGCYKEVDEDTWQGPFEDVYVYIIAQEAGELQAIRNYVEKSDAIAKRQGRVLRHVIFNLNANKLRNDIQFFKNFGPLRPGQATPDAHFEFLSTFRNAYHIRFGKYTLTVIRDPYNIAYIGALYHAYPSPWQIFMQDSNDGSYRVIDVQDLRPSIIAVKRRLMRAFGLAADAGLPEDASLDDVYRANRGKAGTIEKNIEQLRTEGFGDCQWWEDKFDMEVSNKWRLA